MKWGKKKSEKKERTKVSHAQFCTNSPVVNTDLNFKLSDVVPSPSWPLLLSPTLQIVPSLLSNMLCPTPPGTTAITSLSTTFRIKVSVGLSLG